MINYNHTDGHLLFGRACQGKRAFSELYYAKSKNRLLKDIIFQATLILGRIGFEIQYAEIMSRKEQMFPLV